MNLSDTIADVLNQNVGIIRIGKNSEGKPYVQAEQIVPTGPQHTAMNVVHQACTGTLVDCFDQIRKQIYHCNDLKTQIIQLKK